MTKINFVSNIIYRLISVLMRIFRLSIVNFPIFKLVFLIVTHYYILSPNESNIVSVHSQKRTLIYSETAHTHSVRFYWMDWIACSNIKQWCEKKALERTNKKIITIHHEIGKSNAIARKKELNCQLENWS